MSVQIDCTVDLAPTPIAVTLLPSSSIDVALLAASHIDVNYGHQGDPGPPGPQGQGIVIKGTAATHAGLPTTGNTVGDMWITADTGHGWVWQANETWLDAGPIQGPVGPMGPAGPAGPPGDPLILPYDLALFAPGVPGANVLIMRAIFCRAVSFIANLAGSVASAGIAATSSTVFKIAKNGSNIGTLTFGPGGMTGTFSVVGTTNFAINDVLTLTAPTTPDATLANVSVSLTGTRL